VPVCDCDHNETTNILTTHFGQPESMSCTVDEMLARWVVVSGWFLDCDGVESQSRLFSSSELELESALMVLQSLNLDTESL
jgi:hypothetical protein